MKFVLRLLGLVFLAAGFVSLVVDGVKTIAASSITVTPLGLAWFELHKESLNLAQALIQRYTLPAIWDPIIQNILLLPGWVVFTAIGLLFFLLGRKRIPSRVVINEM